MPQNKDIKKALSEVAGLKAISKMLLDKATTIEKSLESFYSPAPRRGKPQGPSAEHQEAIRLKIKQSWQKRHTSKA